MPERIARLYQYYFINSMNSIGSIISTFPAAVMLATCMMSGISLSAQDATDQKIPIRIIEEEIPEHAAQHALALGVNLDPFPTIISAFSREFGLEIQPWFGIDHYKIRFDIAHMRVPDTIAGTKYFYKNSCNSFSVMAEYIFGNNFDGFHIGAGIGVWHNTIRHKYFNVHGNIILPFLKIEGGYIWKFYKNLYLEPCAALDIMLMHKTISIYGFTYKPLPAAGEISVKFGVYVDL